MKLTAGHWSISWGRLPFPGPASGPIRMAQLMQPFPRTNCSGLADSVVVECSLAAWLQRVLGRRPRRGRRWWRPKILSYTWALLFCYRIARLGARFISTWPRGAMQEVRIREWPEGGAWPELPLQWASSTGQELLSRQQQQPLLSELSGAVSPGCVYWSSFSRKFIIVSLSFSQKEDLKYLLFLVFPLQIVGRGGRISIVCVYLCIYILSKIYIS